MPNRSASKLLRAGGPRGAVRPAGPPKQASASPWRIIPAVLLFYAVLLPTEVRVELSGLALYPTRLVELVMLPWIFWQVVQGQFRPKLWDLLFLVSALWMLVAFIVVYGAEDGMVRGGALAIDTALPYILGRIAFQSTNDVRRFLVFVAPGLFLAGLSMLLEVMAARPLVRPLATSVFGALPAYEGGEVVGVRGNVTETRLGLLRATGPFAHPILAGICLSSFLLLYIYSGLRKWPPFVGVVASFLAVFSVSSAAILGIALTIGILVVDQVQRMIQFVSWKIILPAVGMATLVLHMLTENGLIAFLGRYTLNPASSNYRRAIIQYGTESVLNHPWFGIGFEEYVRPVWMIKSSVDNQWLIVAMRFGILPAVLQVAVIVAAIALLTIGSSRMHEQERRMRVALSASLGIFALLGFTVSFYGGAQAWFYMLMAGCISVGYTRPVPMPFNRGPVPARRPKPIGRGPRTVPLRRLS